MRALRIFAVAAVLVVGLIPIPAQAGWNQWARFFGEYWSDGYHAPGDPWNRPPQARHHWHRPAHPGHARPVYYPPMALPHVGGAEEIFEPVPTPARLDVETN